MVGVVRGRVRLGLLVVAVALAAAACGGGSGGSGGGKAAGGGGGQADLSGKLPDRIKQSKTIVVGSDISYAPVEFYSASHQVEGIDFDLADALGKKLGVKFQFMNSDFDNIIPSLTAKRFDIIMSAMSDTPKRQQSIDFVDYFNAGTSILVKKGNPKGIQSLDDFCGKTIALEKGTTQEDVAKGQQAKCQAAGKPKINLLPFQTDTDALLQVKSGRAAADMNDFPVAAYNAKTSGGGTDFDVVGQQIEAGPYGIGVRKDDTQLRDALQAALQAIVSDGTYDQILQKWNVAQGALKTAAINGGK